MRFKHVSAYTSCATVAAGTISGLTGSAVLCGLGTLASPIIGLTVGWKVTQGKSVIRRVSSAAIGSFISFVAFTTPALIFYTRVTPSTTAVDKNWRDKFSEGHSKGEEINQPKYKDVKPSTASTKPEDSEPNENRQDTVCQNSEGKYLGIIAGNSCEGDSKLVTSAPDAGFLGMNKGNVVSYNAAIEESRRKTKDEEERVQEEAKQRKADLAKWGPFFADFEVRQRAIKTCNDYAFKMTGQTRSWFFDDRTDFDIRVIGNRVWVGGPMTVKVKNGNVDGSDRLYQKGVDCYWDKNATSLEGGQITVE
jgi:hypothetical protein